MPSDEMFYVEKVNSSHLLRDCEALRRLLHFLAEHSLQHPNTSLREQEIAEKVFGQRPDFDPRLDSRVRVQVKRLREKLSKYYEEIGADDVIILQIPPGTYQLSFLYRNQAAGGDSSETARPPAPKASIPAARRVVWIASAALLVLLAGLGARLALVRHGSGVDPDLKAFWSPFAAEDGASLVIYGNAQYYDDGAVLREASGPANGAQVNDSFTGVGEVVAAAELTSLFHAFGSHLSFRRCLNVSWDEAKGKNLIIVGAFSAAIKALPTPEKFAIRTLPAAPRPQEVRTRIVNLQPGPGEPAYFAAGPAPCCRVTTEDHALITFSPALSPKRYTLMVAGITTLGTQEAVSFLCRPVSVRMLLSRLPRTDDRPAYFEAVLRIRISDGAPVHSEIVALHLRRSTP